jgi:hypothetical protein
LLISKSLTGVFVIIVSSILAFCLFFGGLPLCFGCDLLSFRVSEGGRPLRIGTPTTLGGLPLRLIAFVLLDTVNCSFAVFDSNFNLLTCTLLKCYREIVHKN